MLCLGLEKVRHSVHCHTGVKPAPPCNTLYSMEWSTHNGAGQAPLCSTLGVLVEHPFEHPRGAIMEHANKHPKRC